MNKRALSTLVLITVLLGGCAGIPKFSSDNTALLVLDIQNAYLPVSGQISFMTNVKTLIAGAREAGIPVIYIAHTTDFVKSGTRGWNFNASIKPLDGEIVVEKRYPSAFIGTDLEKILRDLNITHVIMTGLASSGCYGATARDAAAKGFMTVVVSDAHADSRAGKAEDLNTALAESENPLLMRTEEILFVK